MDDEFKLCWKNFQDNIASGFQNLYDRGDLVDVTLACDGKLLHAHKIVLAICSPYFQEIFITNPCKHPIIILKDVTFNIMCELLEFMYQGVVNVKHTELQSFMKIGQLLQIKGLATNSSSSSAHSTSSDKSSSQINNNNTNKNLDDLNNSSNTNDITKNNNKTGNSNANEENNGDNSNIDNKTTETTTNTTNTTTSGGGTAGANTRSSHSPAISSPSPMGFSISSISSSQNFKSSNDNNSSLHGGGYHHGVGSSMKRHSQFASDDLTTYSRNKLRRSGGGGTTDQSSEHDASLETGGINEQINAEDFFLQTIPHISMVESRYELNNLKRENEHHSSGASSSSSMAAAALRNSFGPFNFDYNLYKNNVAGAAGSGQEYPNDLHLPSDYSKNFGNHMDIPPNGTNVVMLSSTSLLHGNCVFNRNNTVATQQGMKTYWLCKSYRISMCRARCITHQGRVISATGVHNHAPHMRDGNNSSAGNGGNGNGGSGSGSGNGNNDNGGGNSTQANSAGGKAAAGGGAGTGGGGSNSNSNISYPNEMPQTPGGQANMMSAGNALNPHMAGGSSSNMTPVSNTGGANSNARMSQNSGANMYQHNLHAGIGGISSAQQQQQQHMLANLSPPSPPTTGAIPHHILTQSLPNLLIQHHQHHHPGMNMNSSTATSLHESLHTPNSVIHNMMHANASNIPMHLPNLMSTHPNLHPAHLSGQHHQELHHHHHHQAHLEITPLIQSSPGGAGAGHMQSPSSTSSQRNSNNPSHHGANSISSPIAAVGSVSGGGSLKSPAQSSMHDDGTPSLGDQHMLGGGGGGGGRNAALSPSNNDVSSIEASHSSTHSQSHDNQARIIDSITISPSNAHSFKMENM